MDFRDDKFKAAVLSELAWRMETGSKEDLDYEPDPGASKKEAGNGSSRNGRKGSSGGSGQGSSSGSGPGYDWGGPPPTSKTPDLVDLDTAVSIIRAGKRALAQKHHPDRGGEELKMKAVNVTADYLEEILSILIIKNSANRKSVF